MKNRINEIELKNDYTESDRKADIETLDAFLTIIPPNEHKENEDYWITALNSSNTDKERNKRLMGNLFGKYLIPSPPYVVPEYKNYITKRRLTGLLLKIMKIKGKDYINNFFKKT